MRIVGLITGTSADALDVAVADLDADGDELVATLVAHREVEFEPALGRDLLRLLEPEPVPLPLLADVDARLGRFSAEAVSSVLAETGGDFDLVVSHGQTVQHLLDGGRVVSTLQIGQPAWIAEHVGVPVLSDVRANDVAAGGQGAPLASTLDALLLADTDRVTAALNLGGIANVTIVSPDRDALAYDTGPANALMDLMARRLSGGERSVDLDGAYAARGTVLPALLDELLAEPYYALPAPKSTGKELFHVGYLDRHLAAHPDADPHDVIATLTRLTARTVADECARHGVTRVVASGGGTRNPVLMAALADELGEGVEVIPSGDLGLPESAKEAFLMSLLGWLTWHGLPGTLTSCTGAAHPRPAGRLTPGAGPLRLPEPRTAAPRRLRMQPTASDDARSV